jgi:hypothetical protein
MTVALHIMGRMLEKKTITKSRESVPKVKNIQKVEKVCQKLKIYKK